MTRDCSLNPPANPRADKTPSVRSVLLALGEGPQGKVTQSICGEAGIQTEGTGPRLTSNQPGTNSSSTDLISTALQILNIHLDQKSRHSPQRWAGLVLQGTQAGGRSPRMLPGKQCWQSWGREGTGGI